MNAEALALAERFFRHLRTERRLSKLTSLSYRHDFEALREFCDAQKLDAWNVLDSQHVRVFAARQHSRGLSPRSIQRQLSAIRTFFGFLIREGAASINPALDVRAPKMAKHLPHTLDADQMQRLLEFRTDDGLSVRDKAMLELLYSSGLRLQELVMLDRGDLDLADRTVRVTGKGNKARILPVGRPALEALKAWLRTRGIGERGPARAFCRSQWRAPGCTRGAAASRSLGTPLGARHQGAPALVPAFVRHASP
jgi:integrase/recombinase XerC